VAQAVVNQHQPWLDHRLAFTVNKGRTLADKDSVDIPGYPYHMITPKGLVFSLRRHIALSAHEHHGEMCVSISNQHVGITKLLALTFLPNPDGHRHVEFIDGNKMNYDLANLRWTARTEAQQRADTERRLPPEIHQQRADYAELYRALQREKREQAQLEKAEYERDESRKAAEWKVLKRALAAKDKAKAEAKAKAYDESLKAKLKAMNAVDPEIEWINKCAREG
jgi:hypothetical protein